MRKSFQEDGPSQGRGGAVLGGRGPGGAQTETPPLRGQAPSHHTAHLTEKEQRVSPSVGSKAEKVQCQVHSNTQHPCPQDMRIHRAAPVKLWGALLCCLWRLFSLIKGVEVCMSHHLSHPCPPMPSQPVWSPVPIPKHQEGRDKASALPSP